MRSVVKYDCSRKKEITLFLNNMDQVVGVEIFFEEPIDLIDFNFSEVIIKRYSTNKIINYNVNSNYLKKTSPKKGCCGD